MRRRKLAILTGCILLALALSTGTYAYTYTVTASAAFDVDVVEGEIVTSEPAPEQPPWEDMVPQVEYDYEILVPNGVGNYTSIPFQRPHSGEHWEKVATDDGFDSYVATWLSFNYKTDVYRFSDHEEGEGEIASIIVYFSFSGFEDGGEHPGFAKAALYSHGEMYYGPEDSTVGKDFVMGMHQWSANPSTGEPWTWDEVDSLQAGVSLKGDGLLLPAFCTFVSVWVEYVIPPELEGEVPPGDLFVVTPHPQYTGDLTVNLYLTNTAHLKKAFQYLNMKVYMENSLEANKDPDYQMLTLENGVAQFNMEGGTADNYTISATGGSYNLMSGDPDEWSEGWTVTPEFYCEVDQR